MFRTKYSEPIECFTEVGSKILVTPIYDDNGIHVNDDITDLDSYIQSNKDNGNVGLILEKYAVTGDDSYLHSCDGFYGDVSNSQDMTIHERFYANQNALGFYESLPDKVKELYPTAEEFYNSVDGLKIKDVVFDETVDDITTVESEVTNE